LGVSVTDTPGTSDSAGSGLDTEKRTSLNVEAKQKRLLHHSMLYTDKETDESWGIFII
jgi:hypothetical protein